MPDFFVEYKDERVAYTEAKYKEEFSQRETKIGGEFTTRPVGPIANS